MTRHHQPRKGSVAFSPRKRVAKETPSVSTWPESDEAGLLGFAGYKVGMTHVTALDSRKGSPTENMELSVPVTILEAPPLVVLGIRAYTKTTYGLKTLTDVLANDNLDDELDGTINKIEEQLSDEQILAMVQSGDRDLNNVLEDIGNSSQNVDTLFQNLTSYTDDWVTNITSFKDIYTKISLLI